MQFVTFFIEYFVTGCFALFWILLVLSKDPFNPTALKTEQVILLTPLIYVLGMLVDLISYYMVHPRRLLSLVYKGKKGNRQKKRESRRIP